MKNAFKSLSLLSLIFSLAFFISCQKESTEIPKMAFDFEIFKAEIQDHPDYLEYKSAKDIFFAQLANHEIDLFGINNYLKDNEITDYCSIDITLLEAFNGAQKFIESICNMRTTRAEMFKTVPGLEQLTAGQLAKLFPLKSGNSGVLEAGQASNRIDCLGAFNDAMNDIPSDPDSCNGFCQDFYVSAAIDGYDGCCSGGGDGCP